MNCPKCHGTGHKFVKWIKRPAYGLDTARWEFSHCDHPGCHAGQISCAEDGGRDEAAA